MPVSELRRNLRYAIGAEGLQLFQSILMALIIPKLLGVEQFGFWQLFIFYTSYGGFFHLGLLDGIYLKIGGKKKEEVNFSSIASQLKVLIIWLLIILTPAIVYGFLNNNHDRKIVIISSCIYIILYNLISYHSYILQCINEIKAYSLGKCMDMLIFICGLIILIFGNINYFFPYICVYFISKISSLIYYSLNLKSLWSYFAKKVTKSIFVEIIDNIKIGFNLLASNIAGMMILGFGRWMVDTEWGIKAFSKVSFSLLFVNFFLMFIQQASMVLFPDLRRRNDSQVETIYYRMTSIIRYSMPIVLLSFLPFALVISLWFAEYSDSITFLIYLLPLCCFETKMQLIYNTLFKVKRMEKKLLLCNLISLSISIGIILISIYIIETITSVVMCMLIAIFVRSVIAEYIIEKDISNSTKNIFMDIIPEILFAVIFIILLSIFSIWTGWIIYCLLTLLFVLYNSRTYKILIIKHE